MKKLLYFFLIIPIYSSIAQIPSNFNVADVSISTDPNLKIGEVSVFLNSWNPSFVACGTNSNNNNAGVNGQSVFYSEDGGNSWNKVNATPLNGILVSAIGDPAGAIDHNNHMYITFLNGPVQIIESDFNNSMNQPFLSFTSQLSLSGIGVDKDHFEIDDRPIADQPTLYSGWTKLGGYMNIEVRSADVINQTTNWNSVASVTTGMTLPPTANFKYHTGVNIAVGPDGDAYATWGMYYNGGGGTEKYIGFARTSDKWSSWPANGSSIYIPNLIIEGIRANLSVTNCNASSCASWMTMAVNQQNGAIYIAWANMGAPCDDNSLPTGCNTGNKSDIYFIRSSDKGTTWSVPQLVYPTTASSYNYSHWDSWLACDPYTGYLGIIYYGKDASGHTVTYLSLSVDGGVNWTEQQISDHIFNNAIANAPPIDYISLKMSNGWVVPVWTGIDPLTGLQTAIAQPFAMDVTANASPCYVTPFYETIKAQNTVNLSSSACSYNILTGSYVNTYAADYIRLSEGFHASGGSKFHAHIESNPDPFNSHQRINIKEIKAEIIKNDFYIKLFPNPFRDQIEISLTSDYDTPVTIEIYDNIGRLIKKLLGNVLMEKGTSVFVLNRSDLLISQGVYYCVVKTIKEMKSAKLIYIDQ